MNTEKRARYIEGATLRAAQAYARRNDGKPPTHEQLLSLKIQSVEPWKRIVCSALGAAGIFGGGLMISAGGMTREIVFGVLLAVFGLVLFLIGILGRRKTTQDSLAKLGELGNEVLQTVLQVVS